LSVFAPPYGEFMEGRGGDGYGAAMFKLGILFAVICGMLALLLLIGLPRVPYQPPLDPNRATDGGGSSN